jgi:DNA invertase Pin-like site-specific DNA recombinase
MSNRYPVGYIRRSTADNANPGDVSKEAQEAAVHDLAAHDGHNGELRIFTDWGRSADEAQEAHRAAFLSMLAAIERGEVSAVYAYALDRLYRSMRTFVRLTDAAKAHGVRIVTAREGVLGGDGSPMARAFAEITAVFSSLELNTIKARNRGAAAARAARGDAMGQPPYGSRIVRDATGAALKPIRWEDDPSRPLVPVLEAYSRAGSVLGACKLLNAAGVPNARGGDLWQPTSLALILDRAGVLPPRGRRRVYSRGSVLAGLVRCHCGRTMTPDLARGGLYCAKGKWQGKAIHGPSWAGGAYVLAAVRAEADRLHIPFDAVELGQEDDAARESLAERKRRLSLAYAAGALDDATFRTELAAIEATVQRIVAAAEIVKLPAIDWTWPTAKLNATLRAMFETVVMDEQMRVAEIVWRGRVREWRA